MDSPRGKIKDYLQEKTDKMVSNIDKTPMDKFFFLFLFIITIAALGLGYLQFQKNLRGPLENDYFQLKRWEIIDKYQPLINQAQNQEPELSQLQNMDSDFDGLSDYSELYYYQTSPYSEDSDGDGIWDKQEITNGTDPNCPEGQTCEQVAVPEIPTNTNTAAVPATTTNSNTGYFPSDTQEMLDLETKLFSGEIKLSDIGIDDPELQKAIDLAASSQGVATEEQPLSTEDKAKALESLEGIDPQEIRKELESQGMDKSLLDQVDDATLKQMFLQALGEVEQ
jgi:hypothetical protein